MALLKRLLKLLRNVRNSDVVAVLNLQEYRIVNIKTKALKRKSK